MRWKGFIPFLILILGWILVVRLFLDQWIESGIEKLGETIVGARVEIDDLDFRFSDLSIEWKRLQVANPKNTWTNLIETERTAFRMNLGALLRKRVVIEEMRVTGLRSGTPRTKDGALPKKPKPPKKKPGFFDRVKARLAREIETMPIIQWDPKQFKQKLNLDSVLALVPLTTVEKIDSAKQDAQATLERWRDFQQTFRPEAELKKIQMDFQELDPRKINTVEELVSWVNKTKSAQKTLSAISDTFRVKNIQIRKDIARFKTYSQQMDDWVRKDYNTILQKAQIPDLSMQHISKIVIGETVLHHIGQILDLYQTVRTYLPSPTEKPKKQKPPRMKGQNIHYPSRYLFPSFLIREIEVSGQTGTREAKPGIVWKGQITDVTSQPWVWKKPTVVRLAGATPDQRSIEFTAILDHTTPVEKDSVHLQMRNTSLNHVPLVESRYLPSQIEKGKADMDLMLRFQKDAFLAALHFRAKGLNLDFSSMKSKDLFIEILRQVFESLPELTIRMKVLAQGENIEFRMDSNFDEHVSKEFQRLTAQAIADVQKQLKMKLERIRQQKYQEFASLVQEKQISMEKLLENYENEIGLSKSLLEKKQEALLKEIEKRKKEEEKKLKERAKEWLNPNR